MSSDRPSVSSPLAWRAGIDAYVFNASEARFGLFQPPSLQSIWINS
jgi:hypothetical protein